jgi:hypothetical protein
MAFSKMTDARLSFRKTQGCKVNFLFYKLIRLFCACGKRIAKIFPLLRVPTSNKTQADIIFVMLYLNLHGLQSFFLPLRVRIYADNRYNLPGFGISTAITV